MSTTAERIVSLLEANGVERVFGYPGGRVIEVFEALAESDIDVVRPRDERQAAVMAEAAGRVGSGPGVVMGQGPWIASLGAMGLMEARLGSSPLVAITEGSERGEFAPLAPYQQAMGTYGGVDAPAMLEAVTKEVWTPRRPGETITAVQLAFKQAKAGRPGPTAVVLDGVAVSEAVPEDPHPPTWEDSERPEIGTSRPIDEAVRATTSALSEADRPVIIAGNGVHQSEAYAELQTVATTLDAAVVTTYLGKSTIPETHPNAAGVIGSYGHEAANQVVSEADALLVVGARLNPMDANWLAPSFIRPDEQTICQIDIDPRNAGWVYPTDVSLIGDAAPALSALAEEIPADAGTGWARDRAGEARQAAFDRPGRTAEGTPIQPQRAIAELQSALDSDTVVLADSGNNRFWLMHHLQTDAVGTYFGSGGVAGMGWAPPAAVSLALHGRSAVAVAGDGGFTMTMTAVETAREYGVAPTFVVLDDRSLGMVREIDPEIPGVDFHGTDLAAVSSALGADATRVTDPKDLNDAYSNALSTDRPSVVVVEIDPDTEASAHLQSSFYRSVGGLHE